MRGQCRTGRTRNEPVALASAAALAGSAVLMAAPAAHAEVVDVNYRCETPIGVKSALSPIDIKGVKSGSGYKLTMSWQKGVPPQSAPPSASTLPWFVPDAGPGTAGRLSAPHDDSPTSPTTPTTKGPT
ncbi:hypothetical protein SALBM311S_12628 [Streptomyces alboniger]